MFTDIYKDIALAVSPLDTKIIKKLIENTKIYQVVSGARGRIKLDIFKIISIYKSLATLAQDQQNIVEVDINPIVVSHGRLYAVDCKIIIEPFSQMG